MRKQLTKILFLSLFFSLYLARPSWPGQVVTDDVKSWAKKTIKQEKTISSLTAPTNSVAVLYFSNKSGVSDLKLLEKGLTLMVITDLHKVKDIKIVERVKLQALVSELGLTASGLTDTSSSARMGKLLGAANLVGGDILGGKLKNFQVSSNLLSVKNKKIFGQPEVEGKLLEELFKMEKELVFEVIRLLKIQLTPEEELELKKHLTTSIKAFKYYIKAIEYSDAEKYLKAQEYYEKALAEDPNFSLASMGLFELKDLDLYLVRAEAYTEPETQDIPTESENPRKTTEIEKRSDIENIFQTGNIEVSWDFDFDIADDIVVDLEGIKDDIQETAADDTAVKAIRDGQYLSGNFSTMNGSTWTSTTYSYWSGNYNYGFQTIGLSVQYDNDGNIISSTPMYLAPGTLQSATGSTGTLLSEDSRISFATRISQGIDNGFLAYAVQLEEDRMNKKILEMYRDSFDQDSADAREAINDVLGKTALRDRDGWFIQNADAQAGRVLKDNNGDWTRVQQYVLRPNATTVQMLNVSLRKGSSDYAGFSSINWTTVLNAPYSGDLRELPWSSWLDTQGYYIITDPDVDPQNPSEPDFYPKEMSVEFKNPQNEALKESRFFNDPVVDTGIGAIQYFNGETLNVNGKSYGKNSDQNYYVAPTESGFSYHLYDLDQTHSIIDVTFSIIVDMTDSSNLPDLPQINDIWDALRVNEVGAPNIGDNCLGMTINTTSTGLFTNPIDVIYIPMSRMLWKEYNE